MKYFFVLWIVSTIVSIPCPDMAKVKERYADYGMDSGPLIESCAVLHTKEIAENYFKMFGSSEAAKEFVNNRPIDNNIGILGSRITDMKIYESSTTFETYHDAYIADWKTVVE